MNITELLIKSNAVDVIVIDSVAALVPQKELDGEIGDSFRRAPSSTHEPSDAETYRCDSQKQDLRDLY